MENVNEEFKMEINDIKKDRHYKTSKLNDQLVRFKELHNDAIEETTELMDEVLKLKQSLEKSEAIIDAQDNQLIQKRKDVDNYEKKLVETEKRVSNIFKEKLSLQEQLNQFKSKLNESQTKINQLKQEIEKLRAEKDEKIEQITDELDERTQKLTTENYKLTQKLEQREMIQHSYSMRSGDRSNGPNTALLTAGITSISPSTSGSKFVVSKEYDNLSPNINDNSELLIKSATLNSMQDVIKAEETILAQHEYLQKMETDRLFGRHSTGAFSTNRAKKRRSRLVNNNNNINININKQQLSKKQLQDEINKKQEKLNEIRNGTMPDDKEKRLVILLEIATLEDEIVKHKRKIKNIERQNAKKNKKDKNGKENDTISKLTTTDALNYVDAALTLKHVQSDSK